MAKKITAISIYTKDGGWSTPYPIGSTVKEASATIAGILKAYTSTGSNTDGTMTQAAITQAIDNAKTTINTASPTVAGVTKVYTSTGSNTDGTMTQAAITQAIDNAKTTINTASPTVAGVTKVYTSTGSNTDGTMTQAAITQAITQAAVPQALSSSESVEITATWSTTTTTLTGDDGVYYSKSVTMSAGHGDHPTIMLIPGGSNTVPSAAQREAFNDVDFIVANDTALTLYSKVKINTPFVICVKN